MPPTVVTEDLDQAVATVGRYGRAVFKPLYSTKARGMEVIGDEAEPRERIRAYQAEGHRVLYIQQMMDLAGQDFGLTFLGGEFVGAYARVGDEGSWNTTTRDGGRYEPYAPAPEILDIAQRAQAAFGLELCSVDVALTPTGPIVFEVSAFGGFRGMLEGGGVDLAPLVADYALGRVRDDR
jgi:ribosomal protein S6--L-glutamate ligase